jgi:amidase
MMQQGLPVTISFFGQAFSERQLLAYGCDFEQATKARVLPKHIMRGVFAASCVGRARF